MKINQNQIFILLVGFIPIIGVFGSVCIFPKYVGVEAILVAFLGSFFFLIFEVLFFNCIKLKKESNKFSRQKFDSRNKENIYRLWISLSIVSLLATSVLISGFVDNFGFESLYLRPDLFQSNSIVNSFGYLLYLNVFVFAMYFKIGSSTFVQKILHFSIFLMSIISLIFAGNKSYFFQALILFVLLRSSRNYLDLIKYFLYLFFSLLVLFALYDNFVDLTEADSIIDRPMAYIFGGWAVFQESIIHDYKSVYLGDHLLYPFYKILTMGGFSEELLYYFYDIDGFDLNQYSIFGGAYHDFSYFGVILTSIVLAATEYFLRTVKNHKDDFIFELIYWYFVCELILSFFFANLFASLYVYVSVALLLFIGFVAKYRFRIC